MKSSEVLQYQPRGLMQKAESVWRVGRKYIYGNISLARGCLFPPFSLMSGLSNPDRFLQEMGPIYSCAFILLPAPPGCVWKCAFCRNKGIWEHWNDPPEWDYSWQFVLPRACLFLHLPHIFAVSWCCSVQEKHSVLFPSDALLFPKGNKSYVHLQPQFQFSFNAVFVMLHILSICPAYSVTVYVLEGHVLLQFSPLKRKN